MSALLSYVGLLAFGLAVSVEDWRTKKIRNRLILIGSAFCAVMVAWLLLNSALGYRHARVQGLGGNYLPWAYYPALLEHLLGSFVAAIVLWRFSIWPAGDAKFFTVLAAFCGIIDPSLPGFPRFLFLPLLINIFVPAGIVFLSETLIRLSSRLAGVRARDWREKVRSKADEARVRVRDAWPHRYAYAVQIVNVFALFLVLRAAGAGFGRYARGPLGLVAVFALMAVAWRPLAAVLRNRAVGLAAFCAIIAWSAAGLVFWRWETARRLVDALKTMFDFGLFLSLSRPLLSGLIERESRHTLAPHALQRGVVLSDETWRLLQEEGGPAGEIEPQGSEGLSEAEAEVVRGLLERRGAGGFSALRTIPFAFWIFFGALFTLSSRSNIVAVLAARIARVRAEIPRAAGRFSS